MSPCTYYRKGRCASPERCQYKLLARDGKVLCQKDGVIGSIEKTSQGFKKI